MNCPEVRKIVHLFVDGELDPRANVDVLAHLNMCPPCNERFSDAKKFEDFLKEKLRPQPAPPAVKARICECLSGMAAPWPLRLVGTFRRRVVASLIGVAAALTVSLVAWHHYTSPVVCPFVADCVRITHAIQKGEAVPLPNDGPGRVVEKEYPRFFFEGFVPAQKPDFLFQFGPNFQPGIARAYRMEDCAEEKTCVVLYLISAPSLPLGEHNCVVVHGKKFCVWEHDGCRIVTWKNDKLGLYCMAVCETTEMDHEALVNFASVASTQ
jgi:hypothetical protein